MPSDRVTPPFFWSFPPGSSVLPAASGSTPAAEAEGRDSGNAIPRAYLSVTGAARALPGNFPENLFLYSTWSHGHSSMPEAGHGRGLGSGDDSSVGLPTQTLSGSKKACVSLE